MYSVVGLRFVDCSNAYDESTIDDDVNRPNPSDFTRLLLTCVVSTIDAIAGHVGRRRSRRLAEAPAEQEVLPAASAAISIPPVNSCSGCLMIRRLGCLNDRSSSSRRLIVGYHSSMRHNETKRKRKRKAAKRPTSRASRTARRPRSSAVRFANDIFSFTFSIECQMPARLCFSVAVLLKLFIKFFDSIRFRSCRRLIDSPQAVDRRKGMLFERSGFWLFIVLSSSLLAIIIVVIIVSCSRAERDAAGRRQCGARCR